MFKCEHSAFFPSLRQPSRVHGGDPIWVSSLFACFLLAVGKRFFACQHLKFGGFFVCLLVVLKKIGFFSQGFCSQVVLVSLYVLLDLSLDYASQPANLQFPHIMSLAEDIKGSCFQSGNKRNHEPFIAPERFGNSSVGFGSNSHSQAPEKVTLLVDGTRFVVNPQIFTAHPDTMLGR